MSSYFSIEPGRRTGNRFGQIKVICIFYLTEIQGIMKFLKNNQLCTLIDTNFYIGMQSFQIFMYIRSISLLYQSYFYFLHYFNMFLGYCIVTQCKEPCCLINARQSIPMISLSGKANVNISAAFISFPG